MRDPRRDEIAERLRAGNVAPRPDDEFFVTLSSLAAASRREVPRTRARRSTARLTVAAVGTGLLLSGGAVASAFVFIGGASDDDVRDPARVAPTSGSGSSAGAPDGETAQPGRSEDAPAGAPDDHPAITPPAQTPDHALPEQADEHADEQMPPAEAHRRDGERRPPQAQFGERPPATEKRAAESLDAAPDGPGAPDTSSTSGRSIPDRLKRPPHDGP